MIEIPKTGKQQSEWPQQPETHARTDHGEDLYGRLQLAKNVQRQP